MQILMIIRGLPGSGKSTLAKMISSGNPDFVHLEADMYHVNASGFYRYDASKVKDAHNWCQEETEYHLKEGKSVIVSNTFTQHWEMHPYIDMAKRLNVPFSITVCRGEYQNIHGVPHDVIKKMENRWEY